MRFQRMTFFQQYCRAKCVDFFRYLRCLLWFIMNFCFFQAIGKGWPNPLNGKRPPLGGTADSAPLQDPNMGLWPPGFSCTNVLRWDIFFTTNLVSDAACKIKPYTKSDRCPSRISFPVILERYKHVNFY